jgi:hypothetical protein
VKEAVVGDGERRQRFVVCFNPEAAERDQRVRANLVEYLETQIAGTDEWTKSKRDELAGRLRTTPALWRLVRRLNDGRFRIDKAAVAREETASGCYAPVTTASPRPTSPLPTSSSSKWSADGGT